MVRNGFYKNKAKRSKYKNVRCKRDAKTFFSENNGYVPSRKSKNSSNVIPRYFPNALYPITLLFLEIVLLGRVIPGRKRSSISM